MEFKLTNEEATKLVEDAEKRGLTKSDKVVLAGDNGEVEPGKMFYLAYNKGDHWEFHPCKVL